MKGRLCCLALLSVLPLASPAWSQELIPPEVQTVIDRSKSTHSSYSVVVTAEVNRSGERVIETHAEYQQGSMHRVEVPQMRIIADCDGGRSFRYHVATGIMEDSLDQREAACGIDRSVDEAVSGRLLEPVSGSYGRADVIELVGRDFIRRYAVTHDGIIVATAYVSRRADVGFSLRTIDVTVSRERQNPAMFDPSTLSRAFAPSLSPQPNQ